MTTQKKRCDVSSSSSSSSSLLSLSSYDYSTKFAFILSLITLVLLGSLSFIYNYNNIVNYYDTDTDTDSTQREVSNVLTVVNRQLQAVENDGTTTSTSTIFTLTDTYDYSNETCNNIFDTTPISGSEEQCAFAKTCNQNDGVWLPYIFCFTSKYSTARTIFTILLSPIMLLWLVILFRLLGSTAEDYFSPALEMFSVKLGLPPRFAGVTLLALGNGAADVSATIASMVNDPIEGYKMSLGALSGAAMFISCVISASVIIVAHGVPCRGALIRDVMALIITVITVYMQLLSGQIGPESISLFLTLYAIFVVLVLVADVYHRAVVLPRLATIARTIELQRQANISQDINTTMTIPSSLHQITIDSTTTKTSTNPIDTILTALSNYDATPNIIDDMGAGTGGGWGVESDQFTNTNDRPIQLHGQNGILSRPKHHHHQQQSQQQYPNINGPQQQLHPIHYSPSSVEQDPDNSYTILQETENDMIDSICVQPGSNRTNIAIPIDSWYEAIDDGIYEIRQHFHVLLYDNIINDDEMNIISKGLLICELPFTIVRQITVPIPCEGYYCRGLVALSLVVSPLWFVFYLWHGHETNVLGTSFTRWMIFVVFEMFIILSALCIMRYAPKGGENGGGEMSLIFATPIAFYGFVIAATWIDTIADALVSLLNFIGILLHIPGPVIGLTILAWGNSMGDLSANMTMARKGLANMAMTACFAGPVFNILVGLGLGFSSLAAQTGNPSTDVELSPSAITGFIFIAINGVALITIGLGIGKGGIPKQFGYLALVVYSIYLIVSIALQYHKGG